MKKVSFLLTMPSCDICRQKVLRRTDLLAACRRNLAAQAQVAARLADPTVKAQAKLKYFAEWQRLLKETKTLTCADCLACAKQIISGPSGGPALGGINLPAVPTHKPGQGKSAAAACFTCAKAVAAIPSGALLLQKSDWLNYYKACTTCVESCKNSPQCQKMQQVLLYLTNLLLPNPPLQIRFDNQEVKSGQALDQHMVANAPEIANRDPSRVLVVWDADVPAAGTKPRGFVHYALKAGQTLVSFVPPQPPKGQVHRYFVFELPKQFAFVAARRMDLSAWLPENAFFFRVSG